MPQKEKAYPKDSMQDARRKIPRAQYAEVVATYRELKSYNKTAKFYGVSKRTIIFIVRPETLKAVKEHQKRVQAWHMYYDRQKHTLAIQKYRARKRSLGLLIKKSDTEKTKKEQNTQSQKTNKRSEMFCSLEHNAFTKKQRQNHSVL